MKSRSSANSIAICLVAILAAACGGKDRNATAPKDIVTDIGLADGATDYYYVDGARLYRGACAAGQPAFKDNCQTNLQSVDYPAFKVRISKDIADAITALTAAITGHKTAEAAAKAKLADAEARLAATAAELAPKSADLEVKSAQLAKEDAALAQYQQQLDTVNSQLAADPTNAQLLALKAQLSAEQSTLVQQRTAHAAEIKALETAMAPLLAAKTKAEADKALAATSQATAAAALTSARAARDLAREEQDQLAATLAALETSGVGFRVFAAGSDATVADMKPFVGRFRTYFTDTFAGVFGPGAINNSVNSNPVTYLFDVAGGGKVNEVVVELQINLPTASNFDDYSIALVHPDGTKVLLQTAGSNAALAARANRRVRFGDSADVPVAGLAALKGKSAAGQWLLVITDDDGTDSAVHKFVQLQFK